MDIPFLDLKDYPASSLLAFAVFVALLVAWVGTMGRTAYRIIKYGGLLGLAFNAPVAERLGQFQVGGGTKLKVYRLKARDAMSPRIGAEFVTTFLLRSRSTPFTLTRDQVSALSAMLRAAGADRLGPESAELDVSRSSWLRTTLKVYAAESRGAPARVIFEFTSSRLPFVPKRVAFALSREQAHELSTLLASA